jgi:hypothetical protein
MSQRDISLDEQVYAARKALENGRTSEEKDRGLGTLLDLAKRGSAKACAEVGEFFLRSADDRISDDGRGYLVRAAELGYSYALVRLQRHDDPFGLKVNYLERPGDLGSIAPIDSRYLTKPYLRHAFHRWTMAHGVYIYAPQVIKDYLRPPPGNAVDMRPHSVRLAAAYTHALDYYGKAYARLVVGKGEPETRNNLAIADGFASWADRQARQVLGYLSQQGSDWSWLGGMSPSPWLPSDFTRSFERRAPPPKRPAPPVDVSATIDFGGFNGKSPLDESEIDHHKKLSKDMLGSDEHGRTFACSQDLVNLAHNVIALYGEIKPHDGIGSLAREVLAYFCEERLWMPPKVAAEFAPSTLAAMSLCRGADAYQSYYDRVMRRRASIVCRLDDQNKAYGGYVSSTSSRRTTLLRLEGLIARKETRTKVEQHYGPSPIGGRSETGARLFVDHETGHFLITEHRRQPHVTIFWKFRYSIDNPLHRREPDREVEHFTIEAIESMRMDMSDDSVSAGAPSIARLPGNVRPDDHWQLLGSYAPALVSIA